MGQSNAERQRAYRERHLKATDGQGERINIVVSLHAKRQLERLAHCYGVTQRAMLERVLADAERSLLDSLPAEAHGDYDDMRGPLCSNGPAPKSE
jgi:hypothetical protein